MSTSATGNDDTPTPSALADSCEVNPTTAKLSDIVYARIVGGIASGDYPVGSKLPTENELAELLAVSRPIVREALARLRDSDIVISRRGSGTYVRRAPIAADRKLAPLSSISDMRRCLEYRISLEGENAFHAAKVRAPSTEDMLAMALGRLDRGIERDEIGVDDDFAFHFAVAEATGNRFFIASMSAMRESIMSGMMITRNFALLGTRDRMISLHREHVAIFAAIEARDADLARTAMRVHLENAMKRAFEGTLA